MELSVDYNVLKDTLVS